MTEKKISVLLNSDGDRAQMDQSIQSLMNQSSGYWRDTELLIFLKKEESQDENADLREYLQILKMRNSMIFWWRERLSGSASTGRSNSRTISLTT